MEEGKVVLVTGANSGMGKATSIELAKTGALVVMLCRNKERGEMALEEVKALSKKDSIDLMLCDLSSLEQIRNFCQQFKDKYKRLDILINNASVILPGRYETSDGFELQFGVNHLGPFLLTNILLDTMIKSGPARIINVSSGAHKAGRINFDDINSKKRYRFWEAYAQSKLATVLFTYELARRLDGSSVTANCLHPGAVATNMGINRETGFGTLITKMVKPFFQTPLQGAQTAIYLASSRAVEGVTGKYFYKKKAVPSSRLSYDENLAKKLWDLSEGIVGLRKE